MGKTTYFFALRFFLPTFFCRDAEITALPMLLSTPISLHPLCVCTQLLPPVYSWIANPREKQDGTQQHHCPSQGWVQTVVCVFKHQRYITVIQVDKLHLIPDFSKNLHHPFLVPQLRLPDNPFEAQKGGQH